MRVSTSTTESEFYGKFRLPNKNGDVKYQMRRNSNIKQWKLLVNIYSAP